MLLVVVLLLLLVAVIELLIACRMKMRYQSTMLKSVSRVLCFYLLLALAHSSGKRIPRCCWPRPPKNKIANARRKRPTWFWGVLIMFTASKRPFVRFAYRECQCTYAPGHSGVAWSLFASSCHDSAAITSTSTSTTSFKERAKCRCSLVPARPTATPLSLSRYRGLVLISK
jgi:hypothetical protein